MHSDLDQVAHLQGDMLFYNAFLPPHKHITSPLNKESFKVTNLASRFRNPFFFVTDVVSVALSLAAISAGHQA